MFFTNIEAFEINGKAGLTSLPFFFLKSHLGELNLHLNPCWLSGIFKNPPIFILKCESDLKFGLALHN
jgi:hypothetical protein